MRKDIFKIKIHLKSNKQQFVPTYGLFRILQILLSMQYAPQGCCVNLVTS